VDLLDGPEKDRSGLWLWFLGIERIGRLSVVSRGRQIASFVTLIILPLNQFLLLMYLFRFILLLFVSISQSFVEAPFLPPILTIYY
jgi:hypothetical protein